jgi:hypothetical protein
MPVLTRAKDTASENEVARFMAERWSCEVHRTGYMDTWDFFGTQNGRTRFIAELKTRAVPYGTYPTVFLSAHKWLQLNYAAASMNITALFVVRFDDAILYANLAEVDARDHELAGRTDRPDQINDRELIIHVPLDSMKFLHDGRNI